MGRRPGKKAPERRGHLDRWEVADDVDMVSIIEEGGEGFGIDATVDTACAALSRKLNERPLRPMRTEMSVYNRVRRMAVKKDVSIYQFLGLSEIPQPLGGAASGPAGEDRQTSGSGTGDVAENDIAVSTVVDASAANVVSGE